GGIACSALLIGLVTYILFLRSLSRCLGRIDPRNRHMPPGLVWLNLVPWFNIGWMFFTVYSLGASLRREYRYRRWGSDGQQFGVVMGMAFASLWLPLNIPYLGVLFVIPGLFCFIKYWLQVAEYSRLLDSAPVEARESDDELDDHRQEDD